MAGQDKPSFDAVADAWERVFDDVTDLGKDFVKNLRHGYTSRSDAEAAFVDEPANDKTTAKVATTVDRGLETTKEAVRQLTETLGEGRGASLGHGVESAMKATLEQLGSIFYDLAERLRDKPDDTSAPPTLTDGPGEPPNELGGSGA